eukprot:scaffold7456_cov126-Skeletonema_dohrnii-CCMP3373.AAC.10
MLLHHRLSSSALSALLLLAAASNQSATAFTAPTPSTKIHQSNRHINAPITTSLSARKKNADNEESESLYNTSASSGGTNPAKKAALEGVLQRIERNYGRGSIVKLGDADRMIVDVISTGSLTLGEYIYM